jgi:hypothetical protein
MQRELCHRTRLIQARQQRSAHGREFNPPHERRSWTHRLPLRAVYGANIARELLKDETRAAFEAMLPGIADRVGHELGPVLRG